MTDNLKKRGVILAIDDHKMITNGLSLTLQGHCKHFYAAQDGATGMSMALQHFPDIIIVDYALPDITGDMLIRELHYRLPSTMILVYSFVFTPEIIVKILRAGANGYVTKADTDQELLKAIESLMVGHDYFCKEARNHIIKQFSSNDHKDETLKLIIGNTEFSTKEVEIIRLLCKQKNTKEISAAINLAVRTIEQYRSNISRRIGAKNLAGIIRFALKNGLVEFNDL